jgi:RNase P protein component
MVALRGAIERNGVDRTTRRITRGSLAALPAGVLIAVMLAGCGKPAYCEDRANLEKSIKGIGDVQVLQSGGIQDLKSQLGKVQSDAKALVSSAKSDFGSETDAISSSVSKLKTTVGGLPSSPTPQQIVAVTTDAKSVVTAFSKFKDATASKCN